jgi:hypothetical protein
MCKEVDYGDRESKRSSMLRQPENSRMEKQRRFIYAA